MGLGSDPWVGYQYFPSGWRELLQARSLWLCDLWGWNLWFPISFHFYSLICGLQTSWLIIHWLERLLVHRAFHLSVVVLAAHSCAKVQLHSYICCPSAGNAGLCSISFGSFSRCALRIWKVRNVPWLQLLLAWIVNILMLNDVALSFATASLNIT